MPMRKLIGFAVALTATACLRGGEEGEHRNVAFDIAPDSGQIIFSSARGGLYTFNLMSAQVKQIANADILHSTPRFSPDGRSIVYAADAGRTGGQHIFACSHDGSHIQQLTNDPAVTDWSPCYSPDGSQIVFVRAYRHRTRSMGGWTWDDQDICVMRSDGTGLRRITHEKYYGASSPRFLRDGKSVIYSAGLRAPLWKVDAQGSHSPKMLDPPGAKSDRGGAWASEPEVSPDGKSIAFISDRVKPYDYDIVISTVNCTNSKPLGITSIASYNQSPRFMPDGKSILFLAGTESNAGGRAIYSLWQVDIDGKNPKQLAGSAVFTKPPGERAIAEQPKRRTENKKAAAKEREKLQGTWVLTSAVMDGQDKTAELTKIGYQAVIKDDEITLGAGSEIKTSIFVIDTTTEPKSFNILISLGIYELKNDQLKICWGPGPPSEFTSKKGSNNVLFLFKRPKRHP